MTNPSTADMDDDQLAAKASADALAERRNELHDIELLLRIPEARRVISRILARTGPLRQTFDATNERVSSFGAGERNVGLWLLDELFQADARAAGEVLIAMQKPNRLDDGKS